MIEPGHERGAGPHSVQPPPTGPHDHAEPRCWQCGYALSGLRVESVCPECGTPIYSVPPPPATHNDAQAAFVWGVIALALLFVCIGPLAGLVAIPAIIKGGRIVKQVRVGRLPAAAARGAKAGLVLGWITAGLSMAIVVGYGIVLLIALF